MGSKFNNEDRFLSGVFFNFNSDVTSCSFLFLRRSTGRLATANFTTCRLRKWPISWWCSTGNFSAAFMRSEKRLMKKILKNVISWKKQSATFSSYATPISPPAGGVHLLRISRRAVPLAPSQPGAGTAALQRGAALGRHGDPAMPIAAEEDPAAAQVHQDRSAVSLLST